MTDEEKEEALWQLLEPLTSYEISWMPRHKTIIDIFGLSYENGIAVVCGDTFGSFLFLCFTDTVRVVIVK